MRNLISLVSDIMEPTAQIAFVGDIMQHTRQLEYYASQNFDWSGILSEVNNVPYDLVVGNFESTISPTEMTGFPKFAVHQNFLRTLKDEGKFDVLVTTNNHTNDYGVAGIEFTHGAITQNRMKPVGTCYDIVSRHKINDVDIAIHAYTDIINGDVKQINQIFYDDNAKLNDVINDFENYVNIAYVHCGKEYDKNPTDRQKHIARRFKEAGFKGIVFSHSHVVSDFVVDDDNFFIHYGLGNFISDQENLDRQLGQVLVIEINNKNFLSFGLINTECIVENTGRSKVVELTGEQIALETYTGMKPLTFYIAEAFKGDTLVDAKFELLDDIELTAVKTTEKDYREADPADFDDDSKQYKLDAGVYGVLNNDKDFVILKKDKSNVYIALIKDVKKAYFKTEVDIFD